MGNWCQIMAADSIFIQYKSLLYDFFRRQSVEFKQIILQPTNLLTVFVLAVSLILPTWLYLLEKNSTYPIEQIRQSAQISLFLKPQVSNARATLMAEELRHRPEILKIEYIDKDSVYEMFKAEPGLSKQIEAVGENPLPATLFIKVKDISSVEKVKAVMHYLSELPETDLVTMDLYWANKLQALLDVVNRFFWGLVVMFGLAFVLIVFFAVKTVVQERLDEISLTLILGATHRYIKAKFVQMGFWLGLFASLICVLVTNLGVLWVSKPLTAFTAEFTVLPEIQMLNFSEAILLLLLGTACAVLTAWITCTRLLLKTENQLHS